MSEQRAQTPQKNKKTTMIIIVAAVIIALLLGLVIWLISGREKEEEEDEKRNIVVTEGTAEQFIIDLEEHEYVEPGYYEAIMNSTWYFEDGASASYNAYVENSRSNTNDVYFDVELADTGEVILESPVIPLGSYMEAITLDKDLDPGTYDCILIYHLVDEDQNTLSTLRMNLIIVVEG